jgi:hypothetical protein
MDERAEIRMLEEQLEEEQWLHRDEAAAYGPGSSARIYKAFSLTAAAYLVVNTLSVRTPGPAHWLHLAEHVHLIRHIASLF